MVWLPRGFDAASFDEIPLNELAAEPLNFAPSNLQMVERHRERERKEAEAMAAAGWVDSEDDGFFDV